MKRIAFLCMFLLYSLLLLAQSNFLPGSVIKSTGEVVNGFVDYREWSKNPSKISFKTGTDETASSYSVEDLLGFEVTGKEKYVRANIKKDMLPVRIQDFAVMPANNFETETAFVRELFRNDRIGLYIYRDFKDHFYVSEKKGEFVELIYKVRSDGVANNVFRDQLLTYFPELRTDTKVNGILERLNYREADLTGFFYTVTNTKTKPLEKIKPVFFAGTGIAVTTLKISGDYEIKFLDFKTTTSPLLYAGIDIITKGNRGAFVIRPQVSFYNLNYQGAYIRNHPAGYKEEVKYNLKLNNYTVSLGGLYNFWNQPSQKVYGGIEFVGNFSNYQNNELTRHNLSTDNTSTDDFNDLLEYESSWFTVNAMAGAIIMKQFEIGVSAKLIGSFSSIRVLDIKPSVYLVKLGYRF